ncbi:MAG TPA: AbrB/MazE/SpoVT family DNA-binding domain-containing protein [Acidimicrobiales bacterium]|nr:AbrB/MazE/SpoVT family DNA-binding domain-containing protein [Acidimicrobiales bacterium]
MKDTGMARKVDDLGRIVLPVELRRLHGIQTGDALEISVDGDAIVLRKLSRSCVFCGAEEALSHYRSRPLCAGCRSDLSGEDGAQPHTPAVSAY